MTKKKRESQKELKKMYEDLRKFATSINQPDRSPSHVRKTKNKNGLYNRSTTIPVSKASYLKPLDKDNSDKG